jgi:hypothetical protein
MQGVGLANAVFGQTIVGEHPGYGSEIPLVDEPGVGMQNLCDSGSVGELADGDVDGHGSSCWNRARSCALSLHIDQPLEGR